MKAESGDGQGGSPIETAASGRPRAGLPERQPQNRGGRKPAPGLDQESRQEVRITQGRTRVSCCVYRSILTTPLVPQKWLELGRAGGLAVGPTSHRVAPAQ